jgi:excisionase family DNA binding protein
VNDILTADEAAELLGYHPDYVRRLLRQGIVKARQFNGVWMIDRAEVERIRGLQGEGGRMPKSNGLTIAETTQGGKKRMRRITRQELLDEIRLVSHQLDPNVLTQAQFFRNTGISMSDVLKYFPSWSAACEAAGVASGRPRA